MRLIDADAFYEKFRAGGDLYSELLESEDMREILKDEDITPTVGAEPVTHAHWKSARTHDQFGTIYYQICSKCGERMTIRYKYCPYCGAKMDGDTDD